MHRRLDSHPLDDELLDHLAYGVAQDNGRPSLKLQSDGPFVMVDDDASDIELMRRCFAKSEIDNPFLPFTSGRRFIDYMNEARSGREEMPSFVLLDINMQMMDGFSVLERLGEDDTLYPLPLVVFLSNSDNPGDIRRSHKLASAFQEKFDRGADCVAFINGLIPENAGQHDRSNG